MKKQGNRTSFLYNWKARRAIGLLLVCAYIINPYGLLLADGSADNTPDTGVPAVVQQDEDGQAPADVPETPAEDPDAALPQDATDTEDPSDTVSGDDKDITEVPADTEDPKVTEAPSDTEDPSDPSDINDAEDPADTTDPTDATDATDTTDATDAAEPSETPVPTPSEVIPTPTPSDNDDKSSVIEDVVLDSAGKSWKVTATFGAECNIPEGAVLKVRELTSGKTYSEYKDMTEEYLDDRKVDYVRLFDISIIFDGKEIEPAEGTSANVKIRLNDTPAGDLCVLHFPDDDRTQLYEDVAVKSGKTTEVTFDTSGFSVFAVAGYTIEKTFKASDGKTYKFTLTYDDKAGFPDDAGLDIRELTGSEYDDYLTKSLEKMGGDSAGFARIFDVSVVTSDGSKIQPKSDVKVDVELKGVDKVLGSLNVVHFGNTVELLDAVKEGKTITFTASGFSIYALVEEPVSGNWVSITDPADIDSYLGVPLYISQIDGCFATNEQYNHSSTRTGILKTKPQTKGNVDLAINYGATPYYIVKDTDGDYKIYCLDKKDLPQYVKLTTSSSSLSFVSESEASSFVFGQNGEGIYIALKESNYCWNQQGSYSGRGFCSYSGTSDSNACLVFWYSLDATDDPYKLDGEEYGLMYYQTGTSGNALMADGSNNHTLAKLIVRTDSTTRKIYVDEDDDISMWKFNNVSGRDYKLSSEVNGTTVYLKLDSSGISTTTSASEASLIRVTPGGGINEGKVILSCGDLYLTFDDATGFTVTDVFDDRVSLNLVLKTTANLDETMTFSAKEVSVSDAVNVKNGDMVIIYTRIWNDQTSSYDFYAIDHDGILYPCYERGDSIMWTGDVLDSIQWQFTEYYWEGTTDPNFYYELYNPYSGKYIAPQLNGQILSDDKIGINLEGRRFGEYFTDITAWDNKYFNYAAVAVDGTSNNIHSVSYLKGDTFYFAKLNPIETSDELTTIETESNYIHGITMKIKDFNKADGVNQSEVSKDYFNDTGDTKGLLSTDLKADGYPEIVNDSRLRDDFSSVFAGASEVDGLFIKSVFEESGYLEFDSCQNFATLLDSNGNQKSEFTVYKQLGTSDADGRTTLKHGQFLPLNNIRPGVFAQTNSENLYSMYAQHSNVNVGKLPESDPRKYEQLYSVGTPNYYLGLELSTDFVQTPGGCDEWGHPLIFEFSGDDDFWLYVDGELILDLGGIHSAQQGNVNFATGEVVVNGRRTTLRDIFIDNRMKRNPGMTREEAADEIDAENIFTTDDGGQTYQFVDYSQHTSKIFYMERGAGASNLHIRFNLSSVAPGSAMLSKEVTGDASDMDFNLIRYPYQIFYKLEGDDTVYQLDNGTGTNVSYKNSVKKVEFEEHYHISGVSQIYDNVYLIDPQLNAVINFPPNTVSYKIVECAVNKDVYDTTLVNGGDTIQSHVEGNVFDHDSGWQDISTRQSVVFENHVKEGAIRSLTLTKILYDEHGEQGGNELQKEDDDARFAIRLSLSNGSGINAQLVNRYSYYVVDPTGHLCEWNIDQMDFVPTAFDADNDSIKALSDEDKERLTFYSSSYGSISGIPPGYSILVPGLPIGTVFSVEERLSEIPKGYKLIRYHGDEGTYIAIDGADNSGIVRAGYSPAMDVRNMRGWGLTVNKEWTDKNYNSDYDPIYVALYENGQLIDGTVRCIDYPATSTYYFMESTFTDVEAREVTISNISPVIDAEGNVADPGTVTPIAPLGTNLVGVTSKSGSHEDVTYTVDYKQGTPHGSNDNIREDIITNIHEGALVFDLYKWNSTNPLEDGEFTITCDGSVVGEYSSDSNGRITILYYFDRNKDYVLTQTKAPEGYIGLIDPVTFSVDDDGNITITDPNGDGWTGKAAGANGIIGYIKVYNKPLKLSVYKYDKDNAMSLSGAHFTLYRQIYNSITGYTKSPIPMDGFEDMTTNDEGRLVLSPRSDKSLKAGVYYLTETQAPVAHIGIADDVVITISENGIVTIEGPTGVTLDSLDSDEHYGYTVNIPNEGDGINNLKIKKEISGNLGNKAEKFDITVLLTDASDQPLADTEFMVKFNAGDPEAQRTDSEGKLVFNMGHEDIVYIFGLLDDTKFNVTEDSGNYIPEFFVDEVSLADEDHASGNIPSNKYVRIVNTFEGVIPTGISYVCGTLAVMTTVIIAGFVVIFAIIRRRHQYYY